MSTERFAKQTITITTHLTLRLCVYVRNCLSFKSGSEGMLSILKYKLRTAFFAAKNFLATRKRTSCFQEENPRELLSLLTCSKSESPLKKIKNENELNQGEFYCLWVTITPKK